jgi:hypothetical protein
MIGLAVVSSAIGIAGYESATMNGGAPQKAVVESEVLYEDDFLKDLQSGKAFRKARSTFSNYDAEESGRRSNLGAPPQVDTYAVQPSRRTYSRSSGAYRTVCVRLCDGAYFPISTSTSEDRFADDDKACKSRCNSEARLFVYSNLDGSPEQMVDLDGKAYEKLPNAFLFRTKYIPQCQCKPNPWDDEAKKKHELYASKAWQKQARLMARQERRKADRQKHAARAVRRWLERFQVAVSTEDPSARQSTRAAAERTRSAIVRTSYETRSARGSVRGGTDRRDPVADGRRRRPEGRMGLGLPRAEGRPRQSSRSNRSSRDWIKRSLEAGE